MARKKAAPKRKFYVGGSECGEIEQLECYASEGPFQSVEAAKTQIQKNIESGDFDSAFTYFIFEVVATGAPSGSLSWK